MSDRQFPRSSSQLIDKEGRMTREGHRFFMSLWNRGIETNNWVSSIVLKDAQATPHYWELSVDNTGALVTTDLGTSAP